MNPLFSALRKTSAAAAAAGDFFFSEVTHSAAVPLALAGVAAVTAVAFGTFLVTDTGWAILTELRRRSRQRNSFPAGCTSLRGIPTPEELDADGRAAPRTLAIRLRLGSRLADLEPTLDSGTRYDVSGTGARRIASRGRGMKGWLADNRVGINYGTLMRYKRLATRLRRLLGLDDRLPLEWLLPGAEPGQEIPADLRAQCLSARRRLARLLRTHRNFSRLCRHVDEKLGIQRLLAVRRSACRAKRPGRGYRRTAHRSSDPSAAVVADMRSVRLEPSLVEATKRELELFLKTPDLPPRLEKLRLGAIEWLGAGRQPPLRKYGTGQTGNGAPS